jgi:anti-anti-sigma factor
MKVTSSILDDTVLIVVAGEIDIGTIQPMRDHLMAAETASATRVLVDLDHVDFLDGTALSALLRAHERLGAAGKALTVRTSVARTLRVFELVGLTRTLDIRSEEEAG